MGLHFFFWKTEQKCERIKSESTQQAFKFESCDNYPITHSNNFASVIVLERHIKVPLSLSVFFFLMDCISYQKLTLTEKYALPNKSIFNYNSTIAHQVENNYQVGNNQ